MNRRFIDITGKKFGRLFIIRRDKNDKHGKICWLTRCVCGTIKVINGESIRQRKTRSYGCFRGPGERLKHGLCKNGIITPIYRLWMAAKERAKKHHLVFSIVPKDIIIPKRCPVFGTKIVFGKNKAGPNSPSVDRIKNNKGYEKENIWVISKRANTAKSNLSLPELQKLVKALTKKLRSMHGY
jgi:hypothetical protein